MEVETCILKTVKHCWRKLKKTQSNGKISHVHGLEELTLLKCLYYLKLSTDSIPVRIPTTDFIEIEQKIIKFVWNHKRSGIAEIILRKMNKPGGITLPNFKLHCKFPPWRRKWQPTPLFLPGESHGQRSLVSYSP